MGLFDLFKKRDNKIDAFDYADKLFNQGKYLDAIRLMDLAIETNPSNWYYYFRKGKCLQYMNNIDSALSEFDKGLKFEDNFDLNRGLGECYSLKGNWSKSKVAFLKSFRLLVELEKQTNNNFNVDKANILNNLSIALYNLDEIEDAIKYLEAGIKFDPTFSGNYRILGTILMSYDRIKAIELLRKAISLGDSMANEILNDFV